MNTDTITIKCTSACYENARLFTTFQKLQYIQSDFEFGTHNISWNAYRIDKIFHSRYIVDCVKKCINNQ